MKNTFLTLALLTSALSFAHTQVDIAGVFVKSETEQLSFKTTMDFSEINDTVDIIHEDLGVMTFKLVASDTETATIELSILAKNAEGELEVINKPVFQVKWNEESILGLKNDDTGEALSFTLTARNN